MKCLHFPLAVSGEGCSFFLKELTLSKAIKKRANQVLKPKKIHELMLFKQM